MEVNTIFLNRIQINDIFKLWFFFWASYKNLNINKIAEIDR